MGGRASKNKGKSWEREICKFLEDTLGGSFIRVPNSGAFIGGMNAARKVLLSDGQVRNAKGDIIPPDNLKKLNIEAKNYAEIAFHQIMNGSCKQLDEWLDQTETPADPGDLSFTIFKITRKGSWVAFRQTVAHHFSYTNHTVYYRDTSAGKVPYVIADHESFFKSNAAKIIELGGSGV